MKRKTICIIVTLTLCVCLTFTAYGTGFVAYAGGTSNGGEEQEYNVQCVADTVEAFFNASTDDGKTPLYVVQYDLDKDGIYEYIAAVERYGYEYGILIYQQNGSLRVFNLYEYSALYFISTIGDLCYEWSDGTWLQLGVYRFTPEEIIVHSFSVAYSFDDYDNPVWGEGKYNDSLITEEEFDSMTEDLGLIAGEDENYLYEMKDIKDDILSTSIHVLGTTQQSPPPSQLASADNWAMEELGLALDAGLLCEEMFGKWTQDTSRLLAADAIVKLIEVSTGKSIDEIAAEKDFDMSNSFVDTDSKSATFLKAAGISNGVDGVSYGYSGTFTRAQLVTMLGRMAENVFDIDLSGYPLGSATFGDIPESMSWAEQYIGWAAEVGITQGDGSSTTFNPGGNLTNQQTGVFTYRAFDKVFNG